MDETEYFSDRSEHEYDQTFEVAKEVNRKSNPLQQSTKKISSRSFLSAEYDNIAPTKLAASQRIRTDLKSSTVSQN